jgi:hypothetical protein
VGSAQRMALMAMTTLSLLLMAVLVAVFALNGYRPLVAAIAGVWWGLMPLVLFDGGVSATAPAWMIRWREDAMQRRSKLPMQAEIGRWFSKRFAINGPQPWDSAIARSRVRVFGIIELTVWLGVGLILLALRG